MADPITLRVLTDAGVAVEDRAVSVRAPGGLGNFGVLRGHAPLVSTLTPGLLSWTRPGGERRSMRIGLGLVEVVRNRVTVLTERAVPVAPAGRATARA